MTKHAIEHDKTHVFIARASKKVYSQRKETKKKDCENNNNWWKEAASQWKLIEWQWQVAKRSVPLSLSLCRIFFLAHFLFGSQRVGRTVRRTRSHHAQRRAIWYGKRKCLIGASHSHWSERELFTHIFFFVSFVSMQSFACMYIWRFSGYFEGDTANTLFAIALQQNRF